MAHPLTGQTGLEATLFTSVPTVLGMEGAPAFGSDEFWGELAKNTVIIGGMRTMTGVASRGKSFGRDAEEIISQALKKAKVDVDVNNKAVEQVEHTLKTDLGVDIKSIAGMSDALANAYIPDVNLKERQALKISLKKFREVQRKLRDGEIPMEAEKRTKAQNKEVTEALKMGVFLDQVYRGMFENWKNNEGEFFEVLTDLHKKKPSPTEFELYKKELNSTLESMNKKAMEMNELALNPNIKTVEGFTKEPPKKVDKKPSIEVFQTI